MTEHPVHYRSIRYDDQPLERTQTLCGRLVISALGGEPLLTVSRGHHGKVTCEACRRKLSNCEQPVGTVARAYYTDGSGSELALRTTGGWVGERGPIQPDTEVLYRFVVLAPTPVFQARQVVTDAIAALQRAQTALNRVGAAHGVEDPDEL